MNYDEDFIFISKSYKPDDMMTFLVTYGKGIMFHIVISDINGISITVLFGSCWRCLHNGIHSMSWLSLYLVRVPVRVTPVFFSLTHLRNILAKTWQQNTLLVFSILISLFKNSTNHWSYKCQLSGRDPTLHGQAFNLFNWAHMRSWNRFQEDWERLTNNKLYMKYK